MINRQRVQAAFHRGAADYDQHTPVQQRVLARLLALLDTEPQLPRLRILDIGCGTGRLLKLLGTRFPQAELTGLDLAENMLHQAAERLPSTVCLVQGDAEQLPFSDARFDLVVSSSTFQWLDPLSPCFKEVRRVLCPGGHFVFSMFGEGTLVEVGHSWRQALEICGKPSITVGGGGIHRFHSCSQVQSALIKAAFTGIEVRSELETAYYPDLPHLLRAVKRIGAGTAQPPHGHGLGWRGVFHAMAEVYKKQYGSEQGVPANYAVIYGGGRAGRRSSGLQ